MLKRETASDAVREPGTPKRQPWGNHSLRCSIRDRQLGEDGVTAPEERDGSEGLRREFNVLGAWSHYQAEA